MFEKSGKKVSEVEVEMNDGTKITLEKLVKEDFPNVKFDTEDKKTGGKGIALKRGLVSDEGGIYTERRFFKRTNNKTFALGDLSLPTTKDALDKVPIDEVLEEFAKGKRVSFDASLIGGKVPLTPEQQAQKTIDGLRSVTGMPKEVIEATIKGMKKAGFLNVH